MPAHSAHPQNTLPSGSPESLEITAFAPTILQISPEDRARLYPTEDRTAPYWLVPALGVNESGSGRSWQDRSARLQAGINTPTSNLEEMDGHRVANIEATIAEADNTASERALSYNPKAFLGLRRAVVAWALRGKETKVDSALSDLLTTFHVADTKKRDRNHIHAKHESVVTKFKKKHSNPESISSDDTLGKAVQVSTLIERALGANHLPDSRRDAKVAKKLNRLRHGKTNGAGWRYTSIVDRKLHDSLKATEGVDHPMFKKLHKSNSKKAHHAHHAVHGLVHGRRTFKVIPRKGYLSYTEGVAKELVDVASDFAKLQAKREILEQAMNTKVAAKQQKLADKVGLKNGQIRVRMFDGGPDIPDGKIVKMAAADPKDKNSVHYLVQYTDRNGSAQQTWLSPAKLRFWNPPQTAPNHNNGVHANQHNNAPHAESPADKQATKMGLRNGEIRVRMLDGGPDIPDGRLVNYTYTDPTNPESIHYLVEFTGRNGNTQQTWVNPTKLRFWNPPKP